MTTPTPSDGLFAIRFPSVAPRRSWNPHRYPVALCEGEGVTLATRLATCLAMKRSARVNLVLVVFSSTIACRKADEAPSSVTAKRDADAVFPATVSNAAAATDDADDLRGVAVVFRSWTELPKEQQSKIAASVFAEHIVVRVLVVFGCVATAPTQRPKSGYLWPERAKQCIQGSGETYPLRTVTTSSSRWSSAWGPMIDGALQPLLSVGVTDGETSLGLAPPIVVSCPVSVEDTYWLAVPKGRVVVGMTEGSDHCETETR